MENVIIVSYYYICSLCPVILWYYMCNRCFPLVISTKSCFLIQFIIYNISPMYLLYSVRTNVRWINRQVSDYSRDEFCRSSWRVSNGVSRMCLSPPPHYRVFTTTVSGPKRANKGLTEAFDWTCNIHLQWFVYIYSKWQHNTYS